METHHLAGERIYATDEAHFERIVRHCIKKAVKKQERALCEALEAAAARERSDFLKAMIPERKMAKLVARAAEAYDQAETAAEAVPRTMVLHPFTTEFWIHEERIKPTFEDLPDAVVVRGVRIPKRRWSKLVYASSEHIGLWGATADGNLVASVYSAAGELLSEGLVEHKQVFAIKGRRQVTVPNVLSLVNARHPGEPVIVRGLPFMLVSASRREFRVYNPTTGKLVVGSFAALKVARPEVLRGSIVPHTKWFPVPDESGRLHLRIGDRVYVSIAQEQFY